MYTIIKMTSPNKKDMKRAVSNLWDQWEECEVKMREEKEKQERIETWIDIFTRTLKN